MSKITFIDKTDFNYNNTIDAENIMKASDINEIKEKFNKFYDICMQNHILVDSENNYAEISKLAFEDKIDAKSNTTSEEYCITAANINEIKNAINDLIDRIKTFKTFSKAYKYIKIEIPTTLDSSKTYQLELQFDKNNFENENNISYTTIIPNKIIACEVDGNVVSTLTNITSNHFGKTIKIDIEDEIFDLGALYFCRYRFIDNSGVASNWNGIILSVNDI